MKNLIRALLSVSTFGALILNFACAPGSGGTPGGAVTTPQGGPVLEGTVSGGGGNGCDGKAFEADSKKISELEEYRLYVRPVLRRMSEEGGDPMVTYLLWAAEEKAWFFIPCELKKLSNQQIGVSVDSDQLARHGEHGIYIHAVEETSELARDRELKHLPPLNSYYQKKAKDRAALLLHEMVMGARLLMKKPAKEQCTVLAKKDASLCSDPELLAIAEARDVAPGQANIMDAEDHEAVRAMTTFLAEQNSDLSADSVKAVRQRLGFNFPWSRAASNLDFSALLDTFARSVQMGERYRVAGTAVRGALNPGRASLPSQMHPYFKDLAMTCSIGQTSWQNYSTSVSLAFATDLQSVGPTYNQLEEVKKKLDAQYVGTVCKANADRIFVPYVLNEKTRGYDNVPCLDKNEVVTAYDYRVSFEIGKEAVRARGVLRDGVIYDEVSLTLIENPENSRLQLGKLKVSAGEVAILVTREKTPRIQSITFTPKQILKSAKADDKSAPELLDIPTAPAIECARITN